MLPGHPMTSSQQHSLKWTLWKSVGKPEEQLINVKLMSDLLTFWFYNFFYIKIGLAFVFCLQKQGQCFKKHFKMGRLWAIMWSFSWLFFIIDNVVMYISIQCEFRHETKISQDSLQPFSESKTTPADVQIHIYTLHQILPAYSNLCGLKLCLLYE